MIRIGKVSSINYDKGLVAVVFEDKDNIVSDFIPLLSFEYKMPEVNDLVVCAFLSNGVQRGICLGKYYNNTNLPNESGKGIYYKNLFNEGFFKYDNNNKTLILKAENIVLEGNISINGNLDVIGDINSSGNISATGSVTGSNIS